MFFVASLGSKGKMFGSAASALSHTVRVQGGCWKFLQVWDENLAILNWEVSSLGMNQHRGSQHQPHHQGQTHGRGARISSTQLKRQKREENLFSVFYKNLADILSFASSPREPRGLINAGS